MSKIRSLTPHQILSAKLLALAVGVSPLALMISEAQGATVTISGNQTTTISTATADSGNPGDVNLTGSVKVGSGTAVNVNSNNSFTNAGSVQSDATSGGIGINVATGAGVVTGTITDNGSITVNGNNYTTPGATANANPGSNNIGVLIGGNGTFNGDFISGSSSTIKVGGDNSLGFSLTSTMTGNIGLYATTVSGQNSRALSVTGNLTGNITLSGTTSASELSGIGAYVAGNVQGHLYNIGTIQAGTGITYNNKGQSIPAIGGKAAVMIAGNLSTGLLNDHIYKDANGLIVNVGSGDSVAGLTQTAGAINAVAGGYAILVTPNRIEGPLGNLVMGDYGTGNLAYAIVNRGTIAATGTNTGVRSTAIRIEGATISAVDYLTNAGSGIANLFDGTISVNAIDAPATAISIGAGATVPTIRNDGGIGVSTTQSVNNSSNPTGPGGIASGISIDAGATVNQFINSGSIIVNAKGPTTSAYGVIDHSGTIATFTNSGTIATTTGIGTSNTGSTGHRVAADLSYGNENIQFTNSGTITGNVYLGSGDNSIQLTGGTLTGLLDPGAGHSVAVFSGSAILDGGLITSHGQLDLTMQNTSKLQLSGNYQLQLNSLTLQDSATMQVAIDGSGTPGINVTGAAVLSGNSRLAPFISGVIHNSQAVTILQAGSLTVADPTNVVALGISPYMYQVGAVTVTGTSLSLTLTRKTAADLGLSPATGALYENSLGAFEVDSGLAQAVSNQTTDAGFLSAYRQLEPPSFGTHIRQAALVMQDAAFGTLSHRLETLKEIKRGEEGMVNSSGFWVQELGVFYKQKDNAASPGFDGHTYGIALGVDTAVLGLDTLGLGFSQGWSDLNKSGSLSRALHVKSSLFDIYAAWSLDNFFIQAFGSYGFNSYDSLRSVLISSYSSTADANWSARQLSGNLIAGYEYQKGHFSLTPSAHLSTMRLKQHGYTEAGGNGIDLTVDPETNKSTRGGAQLAAAYLIMNENSRFRLSGRLGWDHEFSDTTPMTTARFVVAGSPFLMVGKELSSSVMHAGLGLTYLTSISSLSLDYDYQSQGDFHAHGITATFRVAF